jgi:hypothetical protein
MIMTRARRIAAALTLFLAVVTGTLVTTAGPAAASHTTSATYYEVTIPNVPGSITISYFWDLNSTHTAYKPAYVRIWNNTSRGLTVEWQISTFFPGGNCGGTTSEVDDNDADYSIPIGSIYDIPGPSGTWINASSRPGWIVKIVQTTQITNGRQITNYAGTCG